MLALGTGMIVVVRAAGQPVTGPHGPTEKPVRARKGITFLSCLAVALLAVSVYGANLGRLGVTLGVAGAGVAFALR
ncbi:MAG: hypothetical protein R2882_13905 [Gemmatimonadales bacterium]